MRSPWRGADGMAVRQPRPPSSPRSRSPSLSPPHSRSPSLSPLATPAHSQSSLKPFLPSIVSQPSIEYDGGSPDKFAVSVFGLIPHLIGERWMKRLLGSELILLPFLRLKDSVLEQQFAESRIPLLQKRLQLLVYFHLFSTPICFVLLGSIVGLTKGGMSEIFHDISGGV